MPAPARAASLDVFFGDSHHYLDRRRYEIRLRREIVAELIGDAEPQKILDVGCGDGSISLPLLTSTNHLTLLDVCGAMLGLAEANVPRPLADRVTSLHADVMSAPLASHSYDLILCLGVLAHAESPNQLVGRMASLLRPGGTLILQFTDSRHWVGRAMSLYRRACNASRPPAYRLNVLSAAAVLSLSASSGLGLVRAYRYSSPPPGAHRVFSQQTLYTAIRGLHGSAVQNRNAWLGNEYICQFCRPLHEFVCGCRAE